VLAVQQGVVGEDGLVDLGITGQGFLVSGGSSGIGLATARVLLDEGAHVTICARNSDRLTRAIHELANDRVHAVEADVTSMTDCERVVTAALDFAGRLDGVAALAGRGHHGTITQLSTAEVAGEVGTKIAGLLHLVKAALPHLPTSTGRIVALSAPTAHEPDPAMAAVSAGRAAVDNLVRSLALELAPSGIRVNAVGVGLIDTPRQHNRYQEQHPPDVPYDRWLTQQAAERGIPLARAGTSDEVASAIAFLLSPLTSYTTGTVLDVTGGLRTR
jgi:NAD(P)-dependent dehydrogenase (short-subunit alcohol dehydrogenase family)